MKDAGRYRSFAWYRQRIKTLNEKYCVTEAQLQSTLNELADLSVGEMRAMIAKSLVDGFARLVQTTPKDTGRAQAGWQIGTDESVLDDVPPIIKRPGVDTTSPKAILPEYAVMIREAVPNPGELTRSDIIYIVNNVEYILMLEAGWSKQAPRGFIGNFLTTLRRELDALAVEFSGRQA